MRERFSWRGAAAGAGAGAVLVAGMLAGWLTGGVPVLAGALWERAVRLLPMEVFGFLIVRLKFAAKPLGFWGLMLAVVLACAAAGGLWSLRRAGRPVVALVVAFAAVAGFLALLAGAAFAAPRTLLALGRARGPDGLGAAAAPGSRAEVNRREFLSRSVLLAAALAGAGAVSQWLGAATARAGAAVQSLFDRIKGLPPEVTPTDRFYVVSKNPAGLEPKIAAEKWSLEITGLVGKPVRLTHEQIRAMPSVTRYHTLECISNEVGGDLIGNAQWRGVRFRDLIALAGGVSPTAVRFALRCADGYSEGLPVVEAMHADTMLAYEMNGERLTPARGFPVRLLAGLGLERRGGGQDHLDLPPVRPAPGSDR